MPMKNASHPLPEIREQLGKSSSEEARISSRKFVSTGARVVYGFRLLAKLSPLRKSLPRHLMQGTKVS